MTEMVCERFGVDPVEPESLSTIGLALQTLEQRPIHGLRHPIKDESNGWYIWCGDYSDAENFFQPLHVEHLSKKLPQVQKYLSLPPGFRFLIDDEGYEDIWFDPLLLELTH